MEKPLVSMRAELSPSKKNLVKLMTLNISPNKTGLVIMQYFNRNNSTL